MNSIYIISGRKVCEGTFLCIIKLYYDTAFEYGIPNNFATLISNKSMCVYDAIYQFNA